MISCHPRDSPRKTDGHPGARLIKPGTREFGAQILGEHDLLPVPATDIIGKSGNTREYASSWQKGSTSIILIVHRHLLGNYGTPWYSSTRYGSKAICAVHAECEAYCDILFTVPTIYFHPHCRVDTLTGEWELEQILSGGARGGGIWST